MKKIHVALFDLLRKNWFLDNFRFCENVKNVKYVKFNMGLYHFLQISFALAVWDNTKKNVCCLALHRKKILPFFSEGEVSQLLKKYISIFSDRVDSIKKRFRHFFWKMEGVNYLKKRFLHFFWESWLLKKKISPFFLRDRMSQLPKKRFLHSFLRELIP